MKPPPWDSGVLKYSEIIGTVITSVKKVRWCMCTIFDRSERFRPENNAATDREHSKRDREFLGSWLAQFKPLERLVRGIIFGHQAGHQ